MASSSQRAELRKALAEARNDAKKAGGKPTVQIKAEAPAKPSSSGTKNSQKYTDIDNITVSTSKTVGIWSDSKFNDIHVFDIDILKVDDAVLYGKAMVRAIETGNVTADTLMMMLHLAVSLKSTSDVKVPLLKKPLGFKEYSNYKKITDIETADEEDEIDDETMAAIAAAAGGSKKKKGKRNAAAEKLQLNIAAAKEKQVIKEDGEDDKESQAAVYAYVAAYLMRMQCRQSTTIAETFERFKTRFSGFYDVGKETIADFSPDAESLETIREVLARRPEITNTWVAWVAYNENEHILHKQDRGLLEYLAIQVFAYQGMHVVVQILSIHQISHVPLGMLLREMDCQITRTAVSEVYRIMRDYQPNDKHPTRKTYFRYARVWDDGYFSKVQSKQCSQLLYLAAKVVKELSPNTTSDPTKIYAVANMGESMRQKLDAVAQKLLDLIMTSLEDDEESGSIWKTK
ncbi:TPA_asm: N [Ficus alphacytorhabdovirus 1]|nr:TPA_asm: N [Ficus alphacytorhabdovirus 1]